MNRKPRLAVHKFSSCDGCQLAFLNLGSDLLRLAEQVELVHFAEAGPVATDASVDIAFIEGSITTASDRERLLRIREQTRYLVTMGACATAGGIQALRNYADGQRWIAEIYAHPDYIDALATSTPIAEHVKVDFELWGCPVNSQQILATVNALLLEVKPQASSDKVCMECKRQAIVCVLVTRGLPCLGPITHTGCGALCPHFGRECYGCYGPADTTNVSSLIRRFEGLGFLPEDTARRLRSINSMAPSFRDAGPESSA